MADDVLSAEYLTERIARTKALIVAYENALEALSSGAQDYTLDTGQSRIAVTRANIASLRIALDAAENRLSTLEARLRGASTRVIPGF